MKFRGERKMVPRCFQWALGVCQGAKQLAIPFADCPASQLSDFVVRPLRSSLSPATVSSPAFITRGVPAALHPFCPRASRAPVTDKKLLFARPIVLGAARVRENWFSDSPSMLGAYQGPWSSVNG